MYSTFACAAASYVNDILLTDYAEYAGQLKDTIVLMNDPTSMSQIQIQKQIQTQIQIHHCSHE